MKTLEAKILDAPHLELSEPIAMTPGRSIAISIPLDEDLEAAARTEADATVDIATVRAALTELPGALTEDCIAERGEMSR
jgi:hypothetical protein